MKIHYGNQNLRGLIIDTILIHLNFENLFQWPPLQWEPSTKTRQKRARTIQSEHLPALEYPEDDHDGHAHQDKDDHPCPI